MLTAEEKSQVVKDFGQSANDTLDVNSPVGINMVTYTPGDTVDGGKVLVDGLGNPFQGPEVCSIPCTQRT